MACVNARKDMRELDSLIRTPGPLAVVGAGPVQPFDDSLKAHHLALKIGGLKGWPRWYGVAGTILWQTYEILLLAQSEHGRFTVKAMILDFRQSH
jgi:hypothetical protein